MAELKPHMHKPNPEDLNHCAVANCGRYFGDAVHAPAGALRPYHDAIRDAVRGLSQGAGVPPGLLHSERASGPPREATPAEAATWENTAAPATHTGRPAFHSGTPLRTVTMGKPGRGKTVIDPAQSMYADAMRYSMMMQQEGARKTAEVQDSEVWQLPVDPEAAQEALRKLGEATQQEPDFCDHPNGFGVNGCPCGAVAPDEDEPETVRNINTGEDVRSIRCPISFECGEVIAEPMIRDHMEGEHGWTMPKIDEFIDTYGLDQHVVKTSDERYDHPDGNPAWNNAINCPECEDAFLKSRVRRHLQTVHQWTGDQWSDWAESVNLLELPIVPPELAANTDENEELRAKFETFLNPTITVEDMMGIVDNSVENQLTKWWLDRAKEEAGSVVPKAIEYGSNSLMQLGRKMAQLQGRTVNEDEALELGCWANLVQKVERITDSVMRGERCSNDTIYDVGIYIKMVQRIRDAGSWPGV